VTRPDRAPALSAAVTLPGWVTQAVDFTRPYESDDDRMRLAVALARENVERRTGGPFGAAILERGSGRLVSVGVNSVLRLNNSTAHAEMVAFQLAQHRLASYSLAPDGRRPAHELFTSCAPCAMCLGAALWSGVTRVVCGAGREDAERIEFDEGPVFAESYAYLAARGVEVVHGVLRDEACAALTRYRELGGEIYNT
jgi:tRNA(Arg) A34 adenosine deaminase TadA